MPESTVMVMPFIVIVAVVRIARIVQFVKTGVFESCGSGVLENLEKLKERYQEAPAWRDLL